MQLNFKEASTAIQNAIHFAGENLDEELHHAYSAPGNQSYLVEISDFTIAKKLNSITKDYYKEDYIFSINIPYEYFNDDILPIDKKLGINAGDAIDTKAELRCMNLIQDTWKTWIKTHEVITTKDLQKLLNIALEKLRAKTNLRLWVHAGGKTEIAEKYINVWLTEDHIPYSDGTSTNRWFDVTITLDEFYKDIGSYPGDSVIGEGNLHRVFNKQGKSGVCILRIARLIFELCSDWLRDKWPDTYKKFKNGEF